jgi:hypothetical protein
MTTIYEKLKNAKHSEQVEIAQTMAGYMNAIEMTHKVAEEVMTAVDDSDITYSDMEALELSYNRYGKTVYISNVISKDAFEKLVILLTDKFHEGKKEGTWNNDVRYMYESNPKSYTDNVTVALTVKTSITGCKLIKETVTIPESITPAHEEIRTTVKCD